MSQNFKGLMRFAMENSDGTSNCTIDPERAEWLRAAMSSMCANPTDELKRNMLSLAHILSMPEPSQADVEALMEEIISLTEDINLANDFWKLDGIPLLKKLLFDAPRFIKSDAYQLLGNITQNNPDAQTVCIKEDILKQLLHHLPTEKDPELIRKLLLGISCLTRAFEPGVCEFVKLNGFNIVLDVLLDVVKVGNTDPKETERVLTKGSFVIYCLLQEVIPSKLDSETGKSITEKIISVLQHISKSQEFLLGSLILLLTNSSSISDAVDVENAPGKAIKKRVAELIQPSSLPDFLAWVISQDTALASSNDPADAELRSYLGTLCHLLAS